MAEPTDSGRVSPTIDAEREALLKIRVAHGVQFVLIGGAGIRMRGPVFTKARTPEGFAQVTVDPETGTVVCPDGADLAPDTLDVRARRGAWPGQRIAA